MLNWGVIRTSPFLRILGPMSFFIALLTWISAKVATSFLSEFPSLSLLFKWDGRWYESIARLGYISSIPPAFQKPDDSNVAFFPAYPLLSRALSTLLDIPLPSALPLLSILCAVLVSISLHFILSNEKPVSRFLRTLVLITYPATFYLFTSYSESLYLAAMLGGISLLLSQEKSVKLVPLGLLVISGFMLGSTRLTGFIIPAFLVVGTLLYSRPRKIPFPAGVLFISATAGIASFFAFCAMEFGVWNLYFQQLAIGWYKEFSPPKALALLFTLPKGPWTTEGFITHSRTLSWIVIVFLLALLIYASARAVTSARQSYVDRDQGDFLRSFLVFGALAHFLIVVCGDVGPWDGWGNGIRYCLPSVFLLVIVWRDAWTPRFLFSTTLRRRGSLLLLALLLAYAFRIQVAYLERFIRHEWVS